MVMDIQSALDPAGPQAARIASLFWLFTWVSVAVYAITIAFMAFLNSAVFVQFQ